MFLQYIASWYSRTFAVNGVRREHLARLVVDQRRNAQLNPNDVFGSPLTVEDYLESRWLAEPMCLYDADMPVDAAVAFLVTSGERAADGPHAPVHVAHVGSWLGPRPDFVFHHDYTEMFPKRYADEFWGRAGCSPDDLSSAQLHGNLSEGRLQGGGHVIEAVLQLRGAAGPRQVPGAETCLVTVGGSPTVGAAVLHR